MHQERRLRWWNDRTGSRIEYERLDWTPENLASAPHGTDAAWQNHESDSSVRREAQPDVPREAAHQISGASIVADEERRRSVPASRKNEAPQTL